jgi:hypothetical protein
VTDQPAVLTDEACAALAAVKGYADALAAAVDKLVAAVTDPARPGSPTVDDYRRPTP